MTRKKKNSWDEEPILDKRICKECIQSGNELCRRDERITMETFNYRWNKHDDVFCPDCFTNAFFDEPEIYDDGVPGAIRTPICSPPPEWCPNAERHWNKFWETHVRLNKEVCRACLRGHEHFGIREFAEGQIDKAWNEGWTACPHCSPLGSRLTALPTEDCPYIVEHTVNQDA